MNEMILTFVVFVAVFITIGLVVSHYTGRTPYDPYIIDLRRYEAELLYQKLHRMTLQPPPCTPGLVGREWTIAEIEAMRSNRELAEAIYRRVKEE